MKYHYIIQVGLLLLLLALLAACAQAPLAQPAAEAPAEVEVAAPPEEELPILVESDSAFYAANPELMAASRYPVAIAEESMTGSEFYATNPELNVVQRYNAALMKHRIQFPGR